MMFLSRMFRAGVCSCLALVMMTSVTTAAEPTFRSELVFPLHKQHNHAPGIAELPTGDLLISWYRGSGERKADDVAIFGSVQKAGQTTWGETFLMVDTPGFPDGNTALHVDSQKRLWLIWPLVIANTWESCVPTYLIADKFDEKGQPIWSKSGTIWLKPDDFNEEGQQGLVEFVKRMEKPPTDEMKAKLVVFRERLADKLYQRLGWQVRCKPTVLPSGRIILPLYSDTYSFSLMAISDDNGATWKASKPLMGFGNIQPTVLRRDDGTLVTYMRENGPVNKIRVAESKDDGMTWGPVGNLPIPNPGAGVDAVRLQNGHWFLVYNDQENGRNSLAVSISTDEGRSWTDPSGKNPNTKTRHLEHQSKGSFHYPAVIQSKDGLIHVVYSYFIDDEGKSMKHAVFNEEWVGAESK